MAAIQVQEVSGTGTSTTASATLATPSAGNVLIAVIGVFGLANNLSQIGVPAGWTTGAQIADSGTVAPLRIFYKVADGTEGVVSCAITNSATWTLVIYEWSGLDVTNLVHRTGTANTPNSVTSLTVAASAENTWLETLTIAAFSGFVGFGGMTGITNGYTTEFTSLRPYIFSKITTDIETPGTTLSWVTATPATGALVTFLVVPDGSNPGDQINAEFQYEYNGLVLGAYTPYELQDMTGLDSLPNVRTGSVDRFGQHGGVGGRHYQSIRHIAGTWDIFESGLTDEEFVALRDALQEAFPVIEDPNDVLPFVYKHPGRDKMRVYCRPIDRTTPTDRMFSLGYGICALRLEATDPYIYSNDEHSVVAEPGTTTGGLAFPLDFPLVFGVGSSGGSQSALNSGTAPAPWTATITGETPNPKITHVESGRFIELSGLTVESGQTLEFDSKERSILLDGTASRRGLMTPASSWFALEPGLNTIQFSSGGVATGDLTFRWRDTYWSD